MSITNLPSFSGVTDNAPASPSYLNSKFSQLVSMLTTLNAAGNSSTSSLGIVNVLDYGAVGDGSTDDATAIDSAYASMNTGGEIWFPGGGRTYYRSTAFVLTKPCTVRGFSWGDDNTVGSTLSFSHTSGIYATARVAIRDIAVSGSSETVCDGITLAASQGRSRLENVLVRSFRHGVSIQTGNLNKLDNVIALSNTSCGIHMVAGGVDANANHLSHVDCRLNYHGILAGTGANWNTMTNPVVQSNVSRGLILDSTQNVVQGLYNETNGSAKLLLTSASSANIVIGTRPSSQSYDDSGTSNLVLHWWNSNGGGWQWGGPTMVDEISVNNRVQTGRWLFSKATTTRNLVLDLVDTSATTVFFQVVPAMTMANGQSVYPSFGFNSEQSLGFYRSGASTIAPSYGTLNLASNSVRLSVRTAASFDSTTLAVNEMAFSLNASGASLALRSGGTIYYFASSQSTKG